MAAVVAIAVVAGFAVLAIVAVAWRSVQAKAVARKYLAAAAVEVASVLAEVGLRYWDCRWTD